ncbi:MAG: hypothetical protein ACOH1Y_18185 [Propionicimonas sp.]
MHTQLMIHNLFILGVFSADKFTTAMRAAIGPIILLGVSLFAVKFLAQRQFTQFAMFCGIAVGVLLVFYTPGVLTGIATFVGTTLS